ncbi:cysteine proteinase [Peniophora sp. CONT]|nr:cysteine proteinase [Peniophora sp. CONT]
MKLVDKFFLPLCSWAVNGLTQSNARAYLAWDQSNDPPRLMICLRHLLADNATLEVNPVLTMVLIGRPIRYLYYGSGPRISGHSCRSIRLKLDRKAVLDGETVTVPVKEIKDISLGVCTEATTWDQKTYDDILRILQSMCTYSEHSRLDTYTQMSCTQGCMCACVHDTEQDVEPPRDRPTPLDVPSAHDTEYEQSQAEAGVASGHSKHKAKNRRGPHPSLSQLTSDDLDRLKPGNILNDELVNYGLWLVLGGSKYQEQTLLLSSYFYKKLYDANEDETQTTQTDRTLWAEWSPQRTPYIMVPLHYELHWVLLLGVVHLEGDRATGVRLYVCNSLPTYGEHRATQAAQAIGRFLIKKANRKQTSGEKLSADGFEVYHVAVSLSSSELPVRVQIQPFSLKVPTQTNTKDCGVHVLMNAKTIMRAPDEVHKQMSSRKYWADWNAARTRDGLKVVLTESMKKQSSSHACTD